MAAAVAALAPKAHDIRRAQQREWSANQSVLDRASKDDGRSHGEGKANRKLPPPSALMRRAAGRVLPKIERIERAWSLLMICRTVGLSPQSQLNPKRLARLKLSGETPNTGRWQ